MTLFFFSSRRRHTRLQGDWSSDVALPICLLFDARAEAGRTAERHDAIEEPRCDRAREQNERLSGELCETDRAQIGRASCREREKVAEGGVMVEKKGEKKERADIVSREKSE